MVGSGDFARWIAAATVAFLAQTPNGSALAQDDGTDAAALAQQLSNPVAAMISVPLQFNYDSGQGAGDGEVFRLNIQPVVPISLSEDWNLISRTILPVIAQDDVAPGSGSQSGIGDITQSLFFSPVAPTEGGWIWGAGPALLLPTASDPLLGGDRWAAGPTAVFLRQDSGWTYGGLVNHLWSLSDDDQGNAMSVSYLQPFISYTTSDAWTFGLNAESTYDWRAEQWSVPINLTVSKLVRIGGLPVSIGGGLRYWAEAPDGGPDDIGFRVVLTALFPRG
ncbi:MAG: transporter [Azospirillaceae bacterium]